MADYKEGVDFEYRTVKGKDGKTAYKNRHFFTAAEKAALKAPKTAPSVKSAPAPTKSAKPKKSAATGVTKDPMKGYRKGDVTTAPIGGTGGRTAPKSTANIAATAAKGIARATMKRPERPVSPTRSKTATGRYSEYETARLGNITEAQFDKLTPAQREAKGLPVSWMDYIRSGGDAVVKKPAATGTIAQAGKVGRYAKGGMVKKGKC